ncbi:MAG: neutral/alkaline non-lysosomal ceramidase N-terminal domain-containing protein [Planctomycetia bacterium]|nr:neutral/alkaline non-lysosomal ceramidase N-terminal domain-containing protein [Planctomycetia bacterium]
MTRRCFSLWIGAVVASLAGWVAGWIGPVQSAVAAEALEQRIFSVGVASVDVTPKHPVRLTGYGNRKTEFESVEQPLFAKALALRDGAGTAKVLITVDSLGVTDAMTSAVAARLSEKHKIPRENVAICASHTHSAPALSGAASLIFPSPLTAEERKHIDDYTAELTKQLGDAAEAALGTMRPSTIMHGVGTAKFAVNRRVLKDGVWTGFGVVPTGAVDHALPVLFVRDLVDGEEGKLRAVLINYACHCTTLSGAFNKIHGDWAGCAQEQIERENPGCTALISIGCGADANPNPRTDDLAVLRQHGDEVAREVVRLMKTPKSLKPLVGPITAKRDTLGLPLAALPTKEEFEKRAATKGPIAAHAKLQLARLAEGKSLPTEVPYSVQTWLFGNSLAMVFLPGEVTVDYQMRLKRELDGLRLWINAYSNDSPCYIASKRVLAEGGYEVDGSMYYYDQPQHFAPEVEQTLIAAVHRHVPDALFHFATRFAGDIAKIEARDRKTPPPADGILFIGSSTIVRWKLDKWFSDLPTINHGFGGSQLGDSVYYFDRLVVPVRPRQIVMFAGSNDLALGRSPAEVSRAFVEFATLVRTKLPATRLTYLAITPSVLRWPLIEKQRETNRLITAEIEKLNQESLNQGSRNQDSKAPLVEIIPTEAALLDSAGQPQPKLYVADGLHLSEEGYEIITGLVRKVLK